MGTQAKTGLMGAMVTMASLKFHACVLTPFLICHICSYLPSSTFGHICLPLGDTDLEKNSHIQPSFNVKPGLKGRLHTAASLSWSQPKMSHVCVTDVTNGFVCMSQIYENESSYIWRCFTASFHLICVTFVEHPIL